MSWIEIPPSTPILSLSRPTSVDIPPDLKKAKISYAKQTCISIRPKIKKLYIVNLKTIPIAPTEPPIELSKPTPQPSQDKVFTLEDFMGCVDKSLLDNQYQSQET